MTDRQKDKRRSAGDEEQAEVEEELEGLLDELERERDDYLELARRTKADFENYRRRVASEARDAESRGRAKLVRELLPVLDNLERALEITSDRPQADDRVSGGTTGRPQAGDRAREGTGTASSFVEGVRLVRDELGAVLERSGIESYEPIGEQFDPHLHEAMMMRPAGTKDAGKVVQVLEKGYRLDGHVLRAARVVVGQEQQPSEAG